MNEVTKTELTEDEKLLEESREGLRACIDYEQGQRSLMKDDLRFAALDQWPADLRAARENDVENGARPCLTIDQINQYITQVSNEMRKNRPSIKMRPVDDNADPETAKIFQGLVRHIEDRSSANIAYETAGESAVTMGLGFFRITAEYVANDSFDQELVIRRIPDTFSTYLGMHLMPDGSDAENGWVMETVPLETFKREYPDKKVDRESFSSLGEMPLWRSEDTVTVCEYFYKKYTPETLLFLANGKSVFQRDYDALEEKPEITGERESNHISIMWCKHTGTEVLDKRELKGQYIPIVEVVGKEKIVDGKRCLWGLVRPAKDSLRAFNYWISAMTEKMALSPKAPFIGAVGQFATHGDRWDMANVNNYSKLEYDPIDVSGNAVAPPRRQEPMQMEPAMAQMLAMMQSNVKSSLGMYKAALGDTESQQSGKAILALQRESDTGTLHFGENQALSITHGGRILLDLIPHYYDTKRVLRILGEDGKAETAEIDPEQKEARREIRDIQGNIKNIYNLNVGKYDVTASVGPGYKTSRQEAATVMSDLANTAKDPGSSAVLQYLTVKNSDFHGSEEAVEMLEAMLPPQVQGDRPIPPKAMQKMQQMQEQGQKMQQELQKVSQENQKLKAGAQNDMAELNLKSQKQAEDIRLAQEKAAAEIDLKQKIAQADYEIEQRKLDQQQQHKTKEINFQHECRMKDEQAEGAQTMMPQTIEALNGLTQAFVNIDAILQQQTVIQAKTLDAQSLILEAIQKPKSVSIGAIQRDADGRPIGAIVNSTIQ